jgi:glyoxylase-like metal-dependent hydrolase (beta-lactamase superfamily II)
VLTTFTIGSASVTRIEEVLEQGFAPSFLFPGFDPSLFEKHSQLSTPDFLHRDSGKLISSIHSWLVRLGGKTILIDTCSGNGKARALPLLQRFHMLDLPFLDNLAAADVTPDDVDIVICTHLHVDHVGWNTRFEDGRWVPTFRNARYVFGRAEYDHWTTGNGPELFPQNIAVIADSVLPVVEAGQVDFVEAGDSILPGLTVEAAPGHTTTQLAVKYQAADGGFICTADVLHQPIQIYAPELNSCFCEDASQARATRRRVLDYCADSGALLLPMHFGPPHAGHVRRDGQDYRFEPATPAGHRPS